MYEHLTWDIDEHVVRIGLDRAAKRNAFSRAMLRELAEAYTAYEGDDNLRCAVLHAHGDHFTAGIDLGEVGPAVMQGEALFPEGCVDPLGLGRERTKPVVMAVKGYTFTIGIELLLAADVTVAARSARFAQMEPRRGIMAFGGATLRFHRAVGWHDAMRWLLTGDEFSAEEAHRMGLVQELTETGDELDAALRIARRIAAAAPLAVQATLASARAAHRDPAAEAERLLVRARELMQTEDAAEGLQSFLERREAEFEGR